jgi:hypothetical protein
LWIRSLLVRIPDAGVVKGAIEIILSIRQWSYDVKILK